MWLMDIQTSQSVGRPGRPSPDLGIDRASSVIMRRGLNLIDYQPMTIVAINQVAPLATSSCVGKALRLMKALRLRINPKGGM